MLNQYLSLSFKDSYNKALKHFRLVGETLGKLSQDRNLADILNDEEENISALKNEQKIAICNVLLLEKLGYKNIAINVHTSQVDSSFIYDKVSTWNICDLTFLYFHKSIGLFILGNDSKTGWESLDDFTKGDYLSCFVKLKKSHESEFTEEDIASALSELFKGRLEARKISNFSIQDEQPPGGQVAPLYTPPSAQEVEEKPDVQEETSAENPTKSTLSSKKLKVTPKYSCQVTNELFHNGNVEAWKNIVESYQKAHDGLKVQVFHNGEKINNLNTLFKWGKVKHGDVIMFSVIGESFKNISKLQRYLFEGASNRFNKYLKKDLNKTLELF